MSAMAAIVLMAAASQAAVEQKQTTFPSAQAAADALFEAVQAGDEKALSRIVGGNTELLSSDDSLQHDQDRRTFVDKYREMHRIGRDGVFTVLYVGAANWPFPLPLASKDGAWFFDTKTGREEIVLRRIGRNEWSALDICRDLGGPAAQEAATVLGNSMPTHGYLFRKLSDRSAFVAYPAQYGSSGIKTFLISPGGVVYERDLGPQTAQIATTIGGDAGGAWRAVE